MKRAGGRFNTRSAGRRPDEGAGGKEAAAGRRRDGVLKLSLALAAIVAAAGCATTGQHLADGPTAPQNTAVRPVFTVYGTYPHTEEGMFMLKHGYYLELQVLFEINPNWAVSIGSGHYRIGTEWYVGEPPLEGAPILARFQYGRYSRTGLIRYYFSIGGGHMFYGTDDVDDEALGFTGLGLEVLGRQNLDLRFEWGHLWAFDSRYDQWLGGVGLAYNF
ncbi:MAG TPA: hypothetical protein ENN09_00445 [Planctomycetes bacterium]|nr:hypothetical protein [Planctomycetota bacterium]